MKKNLNTFYRILASKWFSVLTWLLSILGIVLIVVGSTNDFPEGGSLWRSLQSPDDHSKYIGYRAKGLCRSSGSNVKEECIPLSTSVAVLEFMSDFIGSKDQSLQCIASSVAQKLGIKVPNTIPNTVPGVISGDTLGAASGVFNDIKGKFGLYIGIASGTFALLVATIIGLCKCCCTSCGSTLTFMGNGIQAKLRILLIVIWLLALIMSLVFYYGHPAYFVFQNDCYQKSTGLSLLTDGLSYTIVISGLIFIPTGVLLSSVCSLLNEKNNTNYTPQLLGIPEPATVTNVPPSIVDNTNGHQPSKPHGIPGNNKYNHQPFKPHGIPGNNKYNHQSSKPHGTQPPSPACSIDTIVNIPCNYIGACCLRSCHGRFVSIDANNGEIYADQKNYRDDERWYLYHLGHGKYALQNSLNGLYLCAEQDHTVACDRGIVNECEKWSMYKVGNKIALESHYKRWLCAEPPSHTVNNHMNKRGQVIANRTTVKSWEKFDILTETQYETKPWWIYMRNYTDQKPKLLDNY